MAINIDGGKKFGFDHPADMLDKLQWEYDNVSKASFSHGREFSYAVINFAVTAWHMVDWTFPHLPEQFALQFKDKPEFSRWAKNQCRELAACHVIANECKHFEAKKDIEPGIEILAMPGWMGAHNTAPARHMFALAIDGKIIEIGVFANKVRAFWLHLLDTHGLLGDMGIEWPGIDQA